MKKLLPLLVLAILFSCGKSEEQKAQEAVDDGNAKIQRMNDIANELSGHGLNIGSYSLSSEVADAEELDLKTCQKVDQLLQEYASLGPSVLGVVNSEYTTFYMDSYKIETLTSNANYLHSNIQCVSNTTATVNSVSNYSETQIYTSFSTLEEKLSEAGISFTKEIDFNNWDYDSNTYTITPKLDEEIDFTRPENIDALIKALADFKIGTQNIRALDEEQRIKLSLAQEVEKTLIDHKNSYYLSSNAIELSILHEQRQTLNKEQLKELKQKLIEVINFANSNILSISYTELYTVRLVQKSIEELESFKEDIEEMLKELEENQEQGTLTEEKPEAEVLAKEVTSKLKLVQKKQPDEDDLKEVIEDAKEQIE